MKTVNEYAGRALPAGPPLVPLACAGAAVELPGITPAKYGLPADSAVSVAYSGNAPWAFLYEESLLEGSLLSVGA